MFRKNFNILIAFLLCILVFGAGVETAFAQSSMLRGSGRANDAREYEPQILPLSEVLRSLRRTQPGQHLDSNLIERGNRVFYRVKWLSPEGRRIDFIVDAYTGVILRRSGG